MPMVKRVDSLVLNGHGAAIGDDEPQPLVAHCKRAKHTDSGI